MGGFMEMRFIGIAIALLAFISGCRGSHSPKSKSAPQLPAKENTQPPPPSTAQHEQTPEPPQKNAPVEKPPQSGAPQLPVHSNLVSLVAGHYHNCALREAGDLYCWGRNDFGQLGTGELATNPIPRQVALESFHAIQVKAGKNHTCALLKDNGIRCWGKNDFGALGLEDKRHSRLPSTPLLQAKTFKNLALGGEHTCLAEDKKLICWGANWFGQLGNTLKNRSDGATRVAKIESEVLDLAAGFSHTCTIIKEGGAMCWGKNDLGQLGNSRGSFATTPQSVEGISDAMQIALGRSHTCVLQNGGKIFCWGDNQSGQLGNGKKSSTIPVQVSKLHQRAVEVTAGAAHTCARTESGKVFCWGAGAAGQLGQGQFLNSSFPIEVKNLPGEVSQIVAGWFHTCAKLKSHAYCWGDNGQGQLANSSKIPSSVPIEIPGI
jgi:alpha-tubulin suppressor-like RCC1 family protein